MLMKMEQCYFHANEMISDHNNNIYGIYVIKSGCVSCNFMEIINSGSMQLKHPSNNSAAQRKYNGDVFGEHFLISTLATVEVTHWFCSFTFITFFGRRKQLKTQNYGS